MPPVVGHLPPAPPSIIHPSPRSPELPGAKPPAAAAPLEADGEKKILEQLSPEQTRNIPDEKARDLAGKLIVPDDGSPRDGLDDAAVQEGLAPSSGGAELAASSGRSGAASSAIPPAPALRFDSSRPTWMERRHYAGLWLKNLWFYCVTNIVNKWGAYSGQWNRQAASGTAPPVSSPRAFFTHLRVMGETGHFYIPGFISLKDPAVVVEARETFAKYFDSLALSPRGREAFDAFVERALHYNEERRAASKFRAIVRDAMLEASVMDPWRVAAYFDARPAASRTAEFQRNVADARFKRFIETANDVLSEEPADAPDRVIGLIAIGSFAIGAATPTSDIDLEAVTADGTSGRVKDVAGKVIARWTELGLQKTNPVSFHMMGYLNSRWEVRKVHIETFRVISPHPEVVENLGLRPGETLRKPSRELAAWGLALRWLQRGAVTFTSLFVRPK